MSSLRKNEPEFLKKKKISEYYFTRIIHISKVTQAFSWASYVDKSRVENR